MEAEKDKKVYFICDYCGSRVNIDDTECENCGSGFTDVRCPRCNFVGNAKRFSDGCPQCHLTSVITSVKTPLMAKLMRSISFGFSIWGFWVLLFLISSALFIYVVYS